jgi:hypothetical protein
VRRWFVFVLAIALLPWQVAGWASSALSDDNGAERRHMAAHWSGEAHHHHDAHAGAGDGLHHDDSDESLRHVLQTDAHLNVLAVVPALPNWQSPSPYDSLPEMVESLPGPAPFLEGLRRPPRSLLID